MQTQNKSYTINKIFGPYSGMNEITFCPRLLSMEDIDSIEEAKTKISILSNLIFYNTFVVIPVSIRNKDYLFFYSPEIGKFSYRKIYNSKITDITTYKHGSLQVPVFLAKELEHLFDRESNVRKYFGIKGSVAPFQRFVVILDSEEVEDKKRAFRELGYIFENMDGVLFLDRNEVEFAKKEKTFLLC